MRNHVTFVAGGFERSHPGPDADDAPPPGEDLARWLIAELGGSGGLDAAPEPMPEDWGWRVFVSVDGLSANLGVGEYQVGTATGDRAGWLCFLDPPKRRKPVLMFGKAAAEAHNRRVDAACRTILARVHEVLARASVATDVRWHLESDFMAGVEDRWESRPV